MPLGRAEHVTSGTMSANVRLHLRVWWARDRSGNGESGYTHKPNVHRHDEPLARRASMEPTAPSPAPRPAARTDPHPSLDRL